MELELVILNVFTPFFLKKLTDANILFYQDGYSIDATDPEFDQFACWFRAHPGLLQFITEFQKKYNHEDQQAFYNSKELQTSKIPRCIIPFSRFIAIDTDNGRICDIIDVKYHYAIEVITHEELLRPVDTTLPVSEQLVHERQKQENIIYRLKELKDAYAFLQEECRQL